VIARTTVQQVERDVYLNDHVKRVIESFDRSVDKGLSDQNFMADSSNGFYIQDEYDEVPNGIAHAEADYGDMTTPDTLDTDDINGSIIDQNLNAELIFDVVTGSERKSRVVKRANGTSCEPIGCSHPKPLFDT
jgi:hypothetical protein